MDLKMEIYTPLLELVGILEVHRSVIWEEKAFGSGSFSVDALITEESKTLLIPGNIVWISENYAGIIEYVQEQSGKEGPYITVKGPDLTGILGQRILWGQYNMTGTAPAIMHSLVNDSCISPTRGDTEARKIPGLVSLDVPTGGDTIRVQKTGGTLLEALEELGAAFGVAFGVRFNPAIPRMEFWTRWGQNRSVNQTTNDPVFYSTELDDVLSSEYSYNSQDYRNVALVAGEGEGSDRVMVTVSADVAPTPVPPIPVTKCTITLSVDPAGGGAATGGGEVSEGQTVTVTATASSGYTFSGWRENGTVVSTDSSYTFTANADRTLVAVFAAASRLPEGYTEVQYIITKSNTSIETDVEITSDTTKILCDIEPTEKSTDYNSYIFSGLAEEFGGVYLSLRTKSDTMTWVAGTVYYNGSVDRGTFVYDLEKDTRITINMDCIEKNITMGIKQFAFSPVSVSGRRPRLRFGWSYEGGAIGLKMKLYSLKVYIDNELKGDFVPCINPSDITGIYNLVTKEFFYSSHDYSSYPTPGPAV